MDSPNSPSDDDQDIPTKSMHGTRSRQDILLSLIDELVVLRNKDARKADRADITFVDEEREDQSDSGQEEGAANFKRFQSRIKGLDKELQNFIATVRQLGSSVGLISSAFQLRARLAQITHLFQMNAADLFDVSRDDVEPVWRPQSQKRAKNRAISQKLRPILEIKSDPEAMPFELQLLADDLNTLLKCLNEIPEYDDETLNSSVISFQNDLIYWASCLRDFRGQFLWPSVEHHVHELALEMEEHIESVTQALNTFANTGVPIIRVAQKQKADHLQSLSAVATFFSAVTASTLQYRWAVRNGYMDCSTEDQSSYSNFETRVDQLAFHWRSAAYRSPDVYMPWWVFIWITGTPLLFLVISVFAFSAGLVCFTFATYQNRPFIPNVVTGVTSISLMAMIIPGLWLVGERYVFSKTKGAKWLAQMLDEGIELLARRSGLAWLVTHFPSTPFVRIAQWIARHYRQLQGRVRRSFYAASLTLTETSPLDSSLESGHGPGPAMGMAEDRAFQTASSEPISPVSPIALAPMPSTSSPMIRAPLSTFSPANPTIQERGSVAHLVQTHSQWRSGSYSSLPGTPQGPLAQSNALQTSSAPQETPTAMSHPVDVPTASGTSNLVLAVSRSGRGILGGVPPVLHQSDEGEDSSGQRPGKHSRWFSIVPSLRSLQTRETLNEHTALVRDLQFSPDGQFFATGSWDRTAIIWKVGPPFTLHRKLAHAMGFVGQVAWSPNGKYLLTKMTRGIKVWATETGVCMNTIERAVGVNAVTWMPHSMSFLSVEGSNIHCLGINGSMEWSVDLGFLRLHDVVVVPDGERLLGVATMEASHGLLYNFNSQETENQIPLFNEIRNITLSASGKFALVSYEYSALPQLYRIEKLRDHSARLILDHAYKPPTNVEFAGPGCIGLLPGSGTEDSLVLSAGKSGDVFIWDMASAELLHSLRAYDQGSSLTGVAWNNASEGQLMFASAAHDGTVKIWTAPWALDD
ncbi:WD40 repeat-like protein [Clavulina sp. PMI_390]|nr:WD40 repeat-like protein [Clavulina sp. PMI_390]